MGSNFVEIELAWSNIINGIWEKGFLWTLVCLDGRKNKLVEEGWMVTMLIYTSYESHQQKLMLLVGWKILTFVKWNHF